MQKISIVLPIYNEIGTIPELYTRLSRSLSKDFSAYVHEIIFVDDGSCDGSTLLLRKLAQEDSAVKSVIFSRNFGHHIAISAGLDYATGDYVVVMDSDLQDQPESIITLYTTLCEGYDVVYAQRINKQFSFFKKACSALFIRFIKALISEKIEINTTIFRIMRKQVVDEVKKLRETQRYVVGLIGWVGFLHTSVPVEHGARKYGETKYPFFKQIKLALNAIFSFSEYPLRLITYLGFAFMTLSFCVAGYVIAHYFFGTHVLLGWTSLIATVLFMGGVQLSVIGIIGEYLGRLYVEAKKRPLYVVRDVFSLQQEKEVFKVPNFKDMHETTVDY